MFVSKLKIIEGLLLLVYFSYEDIQCKKISTYMLLAGYVTAAFYLIFVRELAAWEYLAAGCVGVLFFFLSLAGESIGMGDSALIMLLGFLFGVRRQVLYIFLAVLLCAVAAAVLMIMGKAGRKSRLPFVPFLLAAFCITLI